MFNSPDKVKWMAACPSTVLASISAPFFNSIDLIVFGEHITVAQWKALHPFSVGLVNIFSKESLRGPCGAFQLGKSTWLSSDEEPSLPCDRLRRLALQVFQFPREFSWLLSISLRMSHKGRVTCTSRAHSRWWCQFQWKIIWDRLVRLVNRNTVEPKSK